MDGNQPEIMGEERGQNMEDILQKLCENRYTENDPEYKETVTQPSATPPCVENWYTRPRKRWDYSRGRGQGNRGQGYKGDGYRGRGHRGGGHQDYHNRRDHGRESHGNYHGNRGRGYHRDEPSRNMYPGKKEYHGANRYEPYQRGYQSQRGRHNQQSHHSNT